MRMHADNTYINHIDTGHAVRINLRSLLCAQVCTGNAVWTRSGPVDDGDTLGHTDPIGRSSVSMSGGRSAERERHHSVAVIG